MRRAVSAGSSAMPSRMASARLVWMVETLEVKPSSALLAESGRSTSASPPKTITADLSRGPILSIACRT